MMIPTSIKDLKSKIIFKLRKQYHFDLRSKYFVESNDYRNTVLVAGGGRSGTTWLGEMINYRNSYRAMFEPFHPKKVEFLSHYKIYQYLRPENDDETYLQPARLILSGAIRNQWVDKQNRKLIVKKRLIKDIRVNMFLKWIKNHFPEIPMVFIIRHPCAVALSRLKENWDPHLDIFLSQEDLMDDFLSPYRSLLEKTTDPFEQHILTWCVQNLVPLNQFQKGDFLGVFYENLCVDPEGELKRVLDFIGEPYKARALLTAYLPSSQAMKHSSVISGDNLVSGWQKSISPEQAKKAAEILAVFGLDKLYNETPMPIRKDVGL